MMTGTTAVLPLAAHALKEARGHLIVKNLSIAKEETIYFVGSLMDVIVAGNPHGGEHGERHKGHRAHPWSLHAQRRFTDDVECLPADSEDTSKLDKLNLPDGY
ncbi:hypothetical protein H310_11104 [Aphanomyces invadans]|uniref:Uncharacterized protein n=1 Tax=Aphanomyces invadans TaxID=157072 RepID=A0A024TNT7_9STRA|nr:hypothetical protein H310_11104 [Aphanomyces invadans]ETV95688.1 hypothetical protein H310_11104 [Aphanomyces invadans]|eukprot:XP_008875881.1 hypothetical protein H310_11104 [Aphanomyces invadans]